MRLGYFWSVLCLSLAVIQIASADIPAVLACAAEPDAKLRLACFDAAAIALKSELAEAQSRKFSLFGLTLPGGGEAAPATGESAKPAAPQLGPQEVNQISAGLVSTGRDSAGHLTVTLDNGQVWRVLDFSRLPVSGGGARITILRNIFGSYYLDVNDQTNNISVARVR